MVSRVLVREGAPRSDCCEEGWLGKPLPDGPSEKGWYWGRERNSSDNPVIVSCCWDDPACVT